MFDVFHCWLHTGTLKEVDQSVGSGVPKLEDLYLPNLTLCKVWVFADFRGIPILGNCAIDALHERALSTC